MRVYNVSFYIPCSFAACCICTHVCKYVSVLGGIIKGDTRISYARLDTAQQDQAWNWDVHNRSSDCRRVRRTYCGTSVVADVDVAAAGACDYIPSHRMQSTASS